MLSDIITALSKIVEFIQFLADEITEISSVVVDILRNIPNIFKYLPNEVYTILCTIIIVAVVYKIFGRD